MNKFNYHFLLSLIFFISCKTKNDIDIIRQDKMVEMLLDLSIIKSINNLNYEKNQLVISPEDFYILQKYNIDSLKWEYNKNYYSERPKILALIYARVQDSLEKKIDSLKILKNRQN